MITYKDIYKFPFTVDKVGWIFDNKKQFVAQFEIEEQSLQYHIINVINGFEENEINGKFQHKNGYIMIDDKDYILLRGWANLTGISGYNLKADEAANIQDTFAEFIVNKLNGKGTKNNN